VKALLLSTSLAGGAGGAAARLQRGLAAAGVDARVLVARGAGGAGVMRLRATRTEQRVRRWLERRPLRRYPGRDAALFSTAWVPSRVPRAVAALAPDIVNLHWVCDAFLSVAEIARLRRPLVWTMHDMWPFTGGCHYSEACERYAQRCGVCPQLASRRENDLSRRLWARKHRAWQRADLTVVAPSRWLADCARRSSLLGGRRVEVIPYGIDLQTFRPADQAAARDALGLPQGRRLLLFGAWANPRRKGRQELAEALRQLRASRADPGLELVTFGPPWDGGAVPDLVHHPLGRIDDPARLARAYAAADAFVLPSRADNLPTTVIEALACGTPCVAFDTGGVRDLVQHQENGFLAAPFAPESLARGIAWVLADPARRAALGAQARRKAERNHAPEVEARRYRELFAELLERGARRAGATPAGGDAR
jgi:glycosyltransferase involved in cell wall biosynthesis